MKGAHSLFPSPATGDASVLVNNSHNSNQWRISMRKHRVIVLCLGLCALLMLAGCGSDGNGESSMDAMDGMGDATVDETALNAAKMAAMAAYEAAKKAVADVEADQSADMASYDEAVKQRDAAMAANTKAQAAETVADAEKYKKMAEDANTEAMKYANMVTTAANNAADKATTAMIEGLTKVIADPDGDGQPTGGWMDSERPGGSELTLTAEQGGVLKYDHDGDSTTTNDIDELGKPDASIDDKMEFAKSTQSAASLTGFGSRVYERTMTADNGDKTTDVLRVYVDSKEAGDVNYFTYFADTNVDGGASADPTALRPSILLASGGLTDGGADGKYTATLTGDALKNEGALGFASRTGVDADTSVTAEDAALFNAVPFNFAGSDTRKTRTYAPGNPQTERTFAGSFAGVPGVFVCGATATCTTTGSTKGQLIGLSTGWTFRPTRAGAEGKVEGVKLDNDYLAYGYWLQTVEKADGTTTYGVNPFADGSMPFGGAGIAAAVSALEGTAEYTGKATGMYALKSFGSGVGVPTAAGQFTADATLNANFGGNSVAAEDHFTVSGSISNFRDTDGDEISGGGWNVSLMEGVFAAGDRAADSISLSGHTNAITGGTTTGGGTWTGMFYGPVTADDTGTVNEAATGYPSGVAGEFNAHLGNGHVIGAFGATKD